MINGLDATASTDVKVFHAGTRLDEAGHVITAGGRVLAVCALGEDLAAAREHAYARVEGIHFADAFYRRDIGHRALRRD